MSSRSWEDLVADGESLKIMEERIEAESGNVRWLWGELALEVAPAGPDGVHTGAYDRLKAYADEIDVSFEALRRYRNVASKWPGDTRVSAQPWVVHEQFISREDREELIANPVDVRTGERLDKWTYRGAQRYLGQKPSPHYSAPPTTSEDKAEAVTNYLADAEVAAVAFKDAPDEVITNVLEALTKPGSKALGEPVVKAFDERCMSWVNRLNGLMMEGAKLANEADEVGHASDTASSHLAVLLYQRLSEKKFDAEVRQLLEAEG